MALFGRGPQTDALDGLIDAAHGGAGGAVLVRGAPGIGKSALLASAETYASALRFTVARVFGEPAGNDVPYAGLQQFARSLGVTLDALAEPQRSALATALGAGEAIVPDVFLVGLAVLNLVVEAAARAPVLLVADDIQWLDDPTASLLTFMARRVRTEPVLLLGAAREGYRARLAADEVTTLTLPPLAGVDAEALLDAMAPGLSASARRRVLSEAAGNPLALTELSRVVASGHAFPASVLPGSRIALSFQATTPACTNSLRRENSAIAMRKWVS